ncbi:ZIP family metal transporter [Fusibacter bizertensis]|uniref:ZIP family metal transporter n=1 Tax=Fusibacter bizertensis TaxID=1488331 RepID=A0ABT6NGD4_9FIRM|nr:ZIP family metal transporter [Fusibacter bizertensis]MDH8679493.1 ZIP family metal transporter [Fusibacter bizertensis]
MAIFALSAMVVNSIGILVIYKNKVWAEKNVEYFMCFAAGVLISSPLIMAFPQAIEKNPNAGLAALIGFVFMFFSNRIIKHKTKQHELAFGITALEGIGIHSFIDGIIYSVAFNVNIFIGILAGIGLVVHEFAEGVITFSVLTKAGLSDKKAIFYAFLVAALTTPIGAFIAFPFVSKLNSSILGLALGFVVGVLIYISASHLLPEVRENEREHSYLAFLAGVGLAMLILLSKQ